MGSKNKKHHNDHKRGNDKQNKKSNKYLRKESEQDQFLHYPHNQNPYSSNFNAFQSIPQNQQLSLNPFQYQVSQPQYVNPQQQILNPQHQILNPQHQILNFPTQMQPSSFIGSPLSTASSYMQHQQPSFNQQNTNQIQFSRQQQFPSRLQQQQQKSFGPPQSSAKQYQFDPFDYEEFQNLPKKYEEFQILPKKLVKVHPEANQSSQLEESQSNQSGCEDSEIDEINSSTSKKDKKSKNFKPISQLQRWFVKLKITDNYRTTKNWKDYRNGNSQHLLANHGADSKFTQPELNEIFEAEKANYICFSKFLKTQSEKGLAFPQEIFDFMKKMKDRYIGDFKHWDACIKKECYEQLYPNADMMKDFAFDELLLQESEQVKIQPPKPKLSKRQKLEKVQELAQLQDEAIQKLEEDVAKHKDAKNKVALKIAELQKDIQDNGSES